MNCFMGFTDPVANFLEVYVGVANFFEFFRWSGQFSGILRLDWRIFLEFYEWIGPFSGILPIGLRCLCYPQDLGVSRGCLLASSRGEVGSRMPSHPTPSWPFPYSGPPTSNLRIFHLDWPLAKIHGFFLQIWPFRLDVSGSACSDG